MNAEQYPDSQPVGNYLHPSQLNKEVAEATELVKVLTEHDNFLNIIRREMRGEQLFQEQDGETYWVQVDKPMFVKLNGQEIPFKRFNKKSKRYEYIANDDAINEIIGILKDCGLNPIAPLTNIDENEIRADLLEMESKIAVLLTVKRKKWGIDKALYPSVVGRLKVLIKDARYRAKDGTALKALRTITSRIEHMRNQDTSKQGGNQIFR